MAKALAVAPNRCTGCSSCALTCSITHHDEFNPAKAHISIKKYDFEGLFHITFASTCKGCLECARLCPSGALRVVEIDEGGRE